ncbi:FAA hydrolase family protein [Amycolatopsis sp. RM579]|uniref:FAA hydrolase family protein n=1 Tax=Amycolatopsis pithecellobii TaxID=664692 RepID=A0A6N7Z945_9PSEU|nr:FAA hydrolase family protein [Amycolatopsis pithecellobii]
MKLASFDGFRIGVLVGASLHDISEVIDARWRATPHAMTSLIEDFALLRPQIDRRVSDSTGVPIESVQLLPPVPAPTHVFAAPLNYRRHIDEMDGSSIVGADFSAANSAENLGFFLKAPGSLIGASNAIELPPLDGRSFHHEPELAVVIGKRARALTPRSARGVVFGYSCLLDITLRNSSTVQSERVMRKSFETFTPMGPFIVTADEVGEPSDLTINLWVNDELRQSASTAQLIVGVHELLAQASHVLTLRPGDIYATGTPEGVGPIVAGDTVRIAISRIGSMSVPVVQRKW